MIRRRGAALWRKFRKTCKSRTLQNQQAHGAEEENLTMSENRDASHAAGAMESEIVSQDGAAENDAIKKGEITLSQSHEAEKTTGFKFGTKGNTSYDTARNKSTEGKKNSQKAKIRAAKARLKAILDVTRELEETVQQQLQGSAELEKELRYAVSARENIMQEENLYEDSN